MAPKIVKEYRREEEEKYLNSKLIKEEEKFIPKTKKVEMLLGAPEDNGLPPIALESGYGDIKDKWESKLIGSEEDGFDNEHRSEKQMRELIEELNPKRFAERAEERFKTHLPGEIAKDLTKRQQKGLK